MDTRKVTSSESLCTASATAAHHSIIILRSINWPPPPNNWEHRMWRSVSTSSAMSSTVFHSPDGWHGHRPREKLPEMDDSPVTTFGGHQDSRRGSFDTQSMTTVTLSDASAIVLAVLPTPATFAGVASECQWHHALPAAQNWAVLT